MICSPTLYCHIETARKTVRKSSGETLDNSLHQISGPKLKKPAHADRLFRRATHTTMAIVVQKKLVRIRKTMLTILFIILGLTGILFIGISSFQEKLIFYPERLPQDYTYNFKGEWKEVSFETEPGVTLNAIHFRVDSSKGLILFFHGNAGSLAGWGIVGENFTALGYDVLAMDFRGYGKSTGKIRSEKQLHSDATFIYDKMLEEYSENQIVLVGQSIGSGMASKLAAERAPAHLLLIAPFFNLPSVANHYFPILPKFIIRFKLPNDDYLIRTKCPVVLIHGTEDRIIPFDHSRKLDELSDNIRLISIEGAGHNNLENFPLYKQALVEVLS